MTPHEKEWRRLFKIWLARLVCDDGWEVVLVADSSIGDVRAQAEMNPKSRKATIRFNPDLSPRNATACHEVVHLLLCHFGQVADDVARTLDDPAAGFALTVVDRRLEELVTVLTARFLAAYGEE